LVSNFAEPAIGCASTEDHIVSSGNGFGEGAYVKFEMVLRRLETRVCSCVAVSGSFYAIRKEICPLFPDGAATDLLSVVAAVRIDKRAISDPDAIARMSTVKKHSDEFQRKVRTVLTGLTCLPQLLPLLNPFRYGFFSIELISHKILRWMGGMFLILMLFTSGFLSTDSKIYATALTIQVVVYFLTAVGICVERLADRFLLVRLPLFFVMTNVSALVACWEYLFGKRAVTWEPSKRSTKEKIAK
jgi:hypothetical protein